jgi:uncharacterized protein
VTARPPAKRLVGLPRATVLDREVPIATTPLARLLGLAYLDREDAGSGLLIPRCASVHTFGMRFPLDLVFFDTGGEVLATERAVPPRRLRTHRRAVAVLELPQPFESPSG